MGLNVDWEILLQYQPIGMRVGMYVTIQQSKLVHILISSVLVMFMLLNYYDWYEIIDGLLSEKGKYERPYYIINRNRKRLVNFIY